MDRPGDAVALYVEAGEIFTAEALAAEHARALLEAGRHEALDAFLTGLPSVIDATRGEIKKRAFHEPAERARIVRASLGSDAGIVGAAYLALDKDLSFSR